MSCPRTNVLLRLAAGELAPDEQRSVHAHLETCAACASQHAAIIEMWKALGEWKADVTGIDLTARVMAEVEQESAGPADVAWRFRSWAVAARAAAILIAVGLGIGAGHLVPVRSGAGGDESQRIVRAEDVVETLGLAHLGGESATGLPDGLDSALPAEGDEPS